MSCAFLSHWTFPATAAATTAAAAADRTVPVQHYRLPQVLQCSTVGSAEHHSHSIQCVVRSQPRTKGDTLFCNVQAVGADPAVRHARAACWKKQRALHTTSSTHMLLPRPYVHTQQRYNGCISARVKGIQVHVRYPKCCLALAANTTTSALAQPTAVLISKTRSSPKRPGGQTLLAVPLVTAVPQ
jgi:hypothetical protein